MKAIPIIACIFLALGSALSLGLMDAPLELMYGAYPGQVAEQALHRFTAVIALLAIGAVTALFWSVRQARKSDFFSTVLCLLAVISTLLPIWVRWQAFQKMKDLMIKPGVDPLDPRVVDITFRTPAATAVWAGLGAISLIGASGFFYRR